MNQMQATIHRFPVSNVYNDIYIFLERFKSENTKRSYKKTIEDYFMFMHKKAIGELSKDDIEYIYSRRDDSKEKLLQKHADQYRNHLKKAYPNSDSTVMAKLSAVRSLYKYLSINGYDVNYMVFDMKFLEAQPNSYDVIPFYLIPDFAEKAKSYVYGRELRVFIYVSSQTSVRVNSLLQLRSKDIKFDNISGFYTISVIDKGNKFRVCPIDNDVYEMIKKLDNDDFIFPSLKQDWINKTIKKIAQEFNELKDKNITTHSLRKTAPTYSYQTTKDVNALCEQSGHKSREIALKTYAVDSYTHDQRAGIVMMSNVSEEALNKLSKEEIISTLKKVNQSAYHQLLIEAGKMNK